MSAEVTIRDAGTETAMTYGVRCDLCPAYGKLHSPMTLRHATNSVAKHNRETHPEPVLNLSAAARVALDGDLAGRAVWEALVGLPEVDADTYARAVLAQPEDVLVHIAPF